MGLDISSEALTKDFAKLWTNLYHSDEIYSVRYRSLIVQYNFAF